MPNTSAYAARSISLFDTEIGVLVAREVNNVHGGALTGANLQDSVMAALRSPVMLRCNSLR